MLDSARSGWKVKPFSLSSSHDRHFAATFLDPGYRRGRRPRLRHRPVGAASGDTRPARGARGRDAAGRGAGGARKAAVHRGRRDPPAAPEGGTQPDEEQVERGKQRFTEAAATVAERLAQRAALATGVSAEVLTANAGLARDRGWAKTVVRELKKGRSVE